MGPLHIDNVRKSTPIYKNCPKFMRNDLNKTELFKMISQVVVMLLQSNATVIAAYILLNNNNNQRWSCDKCCN